MFRDTAFLRTQLALADAQHQTFLDQLIARQASATDERVRALSAQYVEPMRLHQQMLRQYLQSVTAAATPAAPSGASPASPASPRVPAADQTATSDYLALAGDLEASRRVAETFRVFREAGRTLGEDRLATIGESCEGAHDRYGRDAGRLLTALFVGHGRGDGSADLSPTDQRRATVDDHPALADTATIRIRASDTVGPIGSEGPAASYGSTFDQDRNEARDT